MPVYVFISVYILSLLAALVLFITGRDRPASALVPALLVHGATATWLVVAWLRSPHEPGLAFLAFTCSGVASAGWLLRAAVPGAWRLYFSLFFLTLLFFVYSPSRFASFLRHADLTDRSPARLRLAGSYYLEQQAEVPGQLVRFKVIRPFGLFHKTLVRDIDLPRLPDSVAGTTSGDSLSARLFFRDSGVMHTRDLHISLTPSTAGDAGPVKR